MATWGRVGGGIVLEVIAFDPTGRYTPDVVAMFAPVPDGTAQGATANGDGTFTAPPAPPPIVPPPPSAPVVPAQITRWQAYQQMLATPSFVHPAPATLFADTQALVTAAGGTMLLAWQNQQFVYRNGAFLAGLMTPLGLTSAATDALFIAAALLPP